MAARVPVSDHWNARYAAKAERPLLSSADAWLCKRFQEMAATPGEIRRLSAKLRRQQLAVPPAVQATVRRQLVEDGFDPRDVWFKRDEAAMACWTALSTPWRSSTTGTAPHRMLGYLGEWGEVLEKLRERRTALRPKASREGGCEENGRPRGKHVPAREETKHGSATIAAAG